MPIMAPVRRTTSVEVLTLRPLVEQSAVVALAREAPIETQLEALFRTNARYVGAIALKILGSRDDADDVVQDVFVAAQRGLGSLRDPRAIKSWLATLTIRTAKSRLRRKKILRFFRLSEAPSFLDVASHEVSAEDRAMLAQLYSVLDQLPVQERIAWTLRHLHGEQLSDISEQMRCSLATIKRKICAAQCAIDEVFDNV